LSKTHVKGIDGNVERAELTLRPGMAKHRAIAIKSGSKPIDFLWTVRDGVVLGAAAHDPAPGLVRLVQAAHDDPSSLAGEAAVARAVKRLGHEVAFALFIDPRALGGGRAAAQTSSPVVLGIGRGQGRSWLKAEASRTALQAVLRFTEMRR